jgi:hypothetical protein
MKSPPFYCIALIISEKVTIQVSHNGFIDPFSMITERITISSILEPCNIASRTAQISAQFSTNHFAFIFTGYTNLYGFTADVLSFNSKVSSNTVEAKIEKGGTFVDLGSFTPNTASAGTYTVTAAVACEDKEYANRSAKFRVLEQISSVYTNDEDFDKGIMAGVNYDEVSLPLPHTS